MLSSCLPFACLTRRNTPVHYRPRHIHRKREESLYDVPGFLPRIQRALPYAEAFLPPPSELESDLYFPEIPVHAFAEPLEPPGLVRYQSRLLRPPLPPIQPPVLIRYRPRPTSPQPIPDHLLQLIPYREPRPILPLEPLIPIQHLVHHRPSAIPPRVFPIQPFRPILYPQPIPIPVPVPVPIAFPPPHPPIHPLRLIQNNTQLHKHFHFHFCPHDNDDNDGNDNDNDNDMAGFSSGRNFIRGQDAQAIIDAVARQLLGTDYYNRDDDIRFGALRSLGGLGVADDRRIEELMVDDLIRRYEPTLPSFPPSTFHIPHFHEIGIQGKGEQVLMTTLVE
jgi:hypothetical protein